MKSKIEQFKERNQKRNAHLYEPGLMLGYDYVICPVSGERLSMIKSSYITKVLGLTESEYPIVQRICGKRKENIKAGLKQVDVVSGLSKYEIGQIKARKTLNEIDSNGMSGYAKKGQATRATHMSRVDELGRNGYSRLASKAIINGNKTKASKGLILAPEMRDEFYRYKTIIIYLTEKVKGKVASGYTVGLCGTDGAYQLDHKFSIFHSYKNKVSPLVIGNIQNMEMLPWKQNLQKHSKSSIGLDRLLMETNYTDEQSTNEFNLVLQLIKEDIENKIPPTGANLLERLYESMVRK